jgi:hypothetical protein
MGWFESPQYLKSIQKIKSMSPEDRAVTQTLADELSGLYAGEDQQKQIQAINFAIGKKAREDDRRLQSGRLDLSKKGLGLSREGLELDRDYLGLSGERLGLKRDYLDLSGEMRGRRQALAEKEFDYAKDEADTAQLYGWGNIGLSGLSGYLNMRDKKKRAEDFKSLIELYGKK